MRYPPEHKETTRRAILMAAGAVFRRQGYQGSGIDKIMTEAGLTVGGFYAHFKNKEDLLCQMLRESPEIMLEFVSEENRKLEGPEWVTAYIQDYLSEKHVRELESTCSIPSLMSEIERRDQACRDAFAGLHTFWTDLVASKLTNLSEEERGVTARAIVSVVMGTAATARALIGTDAFVTTLESGRLAAEGLAKRGVSA